MVSGQYCCLSEGLGDLGAFHYVNQIFEVRTSKHYAAQLHCCKNTWTKLL